MTSCRIISQQKILRRLLLNLFLRMITFCILHSAHTLTSRIKSSSSYLAGDVRAAENYFGAVFNPERVVFALELNPGPKR